MPQRMYCPKCEKFVKAYKSKGKFYCEECSERTITEFEKNNPELAKLTKNIASLLVVVFCGWCAYSCHSISEERDKLDSLIRQRKELYCQTHKSQCTQYDKEIKDWENCQSMKNGMIASGSSRESINNVIGSCYLPSHPSEDDEKFIKAHPDLFPRDEYGEIKK